MIAVLNKGDKAQVLGEEILKACKVYKIKLADGRVGYVTAGNDFRAFEYYRTEKFAIIEDSTNVMSMADSVDTPGNKVIAVLQKGEQVRAISEHGWKLVTYYNIKLDDGRTGYVNGNDKISLVEE